MALVAAGALIGAISVGGAYLFGATLVASMLAGAAIGSLFEMANIDLEFQSPTYSFGPTSNSKTQVLPIPVVYGTMRVAGNIFYENFLDDKKTKVERMVGVSEGPVQSITGVQFDVLGPPPCVASRDFTGMRGSYGGVLMFGMLTSFAGLGMFNPLSLGAGLVLGRKAYKEDMENRMLRVRGEAKMNVRRFVDDVSFAVGKESRDRLRNIQRHLRDHYRGIANQTTRSLNESLQATLAAAQIEAGERDNRVRELERQLNILRQVIDNAVKLTPALAQ